MAGPPETGGPAWPCAYASRLEEADDAVESVADRAREDAEREDDTQRDDGENHAVLGHGLPLLALAAGVHPRVQMGEEAGHCFTSLHRLGHPRPGAVNRQSRATKVRPVWSE